MGLPYPEITSEEHPVYDIDKARRAAPFIEYRALSMMKHKNIQVACVTKGCSLLDIKEVMKQRCGFCFMFQSCRTCTLGGSSHCTRHVEYTYVINAKTKKAFKKHHLAWCRKLGLL